MKYKICKDTNPIMRKTSNDVILPISKEDKETLDFMLTYLRKSQDENYARKHNIQAGVGIAGIQLGLLKRMFAIYYEREDGTIVQYQLVNPKIIESSLKMAALEGGEGCLSVENRHEGLVHRHLSIKMEAFDALTNKNIIINASGYDAIVLQHEFDHLNGVFYYDHIDTKNPFTPYKGEEII